MAKDPVLAKAKKEVIENLEIIRVLLDQCVDKGMIDDDSKYYNELLGLIADAQIVEEWEELTEIITLAKILEVDIDTWISIHGGSSLSLLWPHKEG